MRLRRAALRLHRWGGLATGAVVSVVALSVGEDPETGIAGYG